MMNVQGRQKSARYKLNMHVGEETTYILNKVVLFIKVLGINLLNVFEVNVIIFTEIDALYLSRLNVRIVTNRPLNSVLSVRILPSRDTKSTFNIHLVWSSFECIYLKLNYAPRMQIISFLYLCY